MPAKIKPDERTFEQLRALGEIQCTMEETAAVMLTTHESLRRFFRRHPRFAAGYESAKLAGKMSLRRAQWHSATVKGNVVMQIWLGKQWLNQKDRVETDATLQHTITVELAAILRGVDGQQRSLPEGRAAEIAADEAARANGANGHANGANGHANGANGNGHAIAEAEVLPPEHPMKRFN